MMNERKSLTGMEYHTPSSPHHKGRARASGRSRMSCRVSDRKMLMRTLPMHWKKLVMTACDATTTKTSMLSRIPRADIWMRVGSVVKMRANCTGKSMASSQPTKRMAVAEAMASHRHRHMRSYLCAP